MPRVRSSHLAIGMLVSLASSCNVSAQSYTFTDLGVGAATGVNNSGQIVGYLYSINSYAEHATLWNRTSPTDLGTLGGSFTNSRALGINDVGQVVGNSYSTSYPVTQHAVLWSDTGLKDLGTLGGTNSAATGINKSGQVIGNSDTTANNAQAATLWSSSSAINLGTLGGSGASANGINNIGIVVGGSATAIASFPPINHATEWSGSTVIDLGTLGGKSSAALAINNSGEVVGWSDITGDTTYHATLWNGTSTVDLGTLAAGKSSVATAINNAGQVVGYSYDASGMKGILWNGTQAMDLNAFLDSNAVKAGWSIYQANGINDQGWIVGQAVNLATGANDAFLLTPTTPVPEPETYAMLFAGLGLLGVMVTRNRYAGSSCLRQ